MLISTLFQGIMSQLSRNIKDSARAKGYEDAFKIFILDVGLLVALFRRLNPQGEEAKKILA